MRGSVAGKRQFVYRAAAEYNSLPPPEFFNMSAFVFANKLRQRLSETT